MPVPKFSKFLHGTALLFQQRCAEMPYWFLPGGCPAWTAALCLLPLPRPRGQCTVCGCSCQALNMPLLGHAQQKHAHHLLLPRTTV